jgi:hypothetical protein
MHARLRTKVFRQLIWFEAQLWKVCAELVWALHTRMKGGEKKRLGVDCVWKGCGEIFWALRMRMEGGERLGLIA